MEEAVNDGDVVRFAKWIYEMLGKDKAKTRALIKALQFEMKQQQNYYK
jgi:hypothetical protein